MLKGGPPPACSSSARAALFGAVCALLALYAVTLSSTLVFGGAAGGAAAGGAPSIRAELGRGMWTVLHRAAQKFPVAPSERERATLAGFISALGELYPCDECAEHRRGMLAATPVDTRSGPQFAAWLCARHNQVNARLGKPAFSCTPEALEERWGDCGCSEGSDGGKEAAALDVAEHGALRANRP